MKYLNFKLLIFFAALALASPPAWAGTVTDVLTAADFTATNSNYTDFSNVTKNSAAVYAGNSARNGDNIQLRGSSPSGIFTTTSGGKVRSITINFANNTVSGRIVNVYGKNEAYETGSEMYAFSTQGTSLGSAKYTTGQLSYTIDVTDDYQYIAIRSSSGALYLTSISITWETEGGDTPAQVATPTFNPEAGTFDEPQSVTISCATSGAAIYYTTDGSTPDEDSEYYSTPIYVDKTTTIKAIALRDDMIPSVVADATYTIETGTFSTAVLDFTDSTFWTPNLTKNKVVEERSFFDGTYTVKIAGSTGNGYYHTGSYLLLGKQGAYIQLPAFNKPVKKIFVEGTNTASESVKQNIFVGETAVSTETYGKGDHTYEINPDYQSGKIYTLKVTNAYNTQVKRITVYLDESAPTVSIINVDPESVTINDNTGEIKAATVTATVTPAGTVTATATTGWTANVGENKVTYDGRALFADGTATYSSSNASDVTVPLEYNYTGPLYILGTVNGGTWAPNNYVEMTRGDNGLYSVTLTTVAGNEGQSWISFTKRVANDNDNGAWAYIAPYRFVPYSEDVNTAWWLTESTVNDFFDLDFDLSHVDYQPVRMAPGTYTVTIDPKNNKFMIEPYILTVETPTFDPAAGSYKAFQSVTINCATQEATIHYTIDGTEPTADSPVYEEPIAVETTTTIKAIAMKDGMANSAVAVATYTLPRTVATTGEANALDGNTYFLFSGNAVVTYAGKSSTNSNYHYIFIRDKGAENGGGVIFYNTSDDAAVPSVQATNVLKRGWYAQLRPYKNWKEYQYAENVEASGETANADPFDRSGMELSLDDNVNEYIKIDTVTYSNDAITYAGKNRDDVTYTYTVLNHFNVELENGKQYNIQGVVTRYNSNIEFYPTAATLVKQNPGLAFADSTVTVYEGVQNFPEPVLTNETGLPVSYESNNADVATVDEEGNVTIMGVGTATITASVEESTYYTAGSASYDIIVKAKEAAGLSFTAGTVEATYGETVTAPTLTNDANLPVTYESSDTTVVKVDANGNLTIVGAGNATITASTVGDETHAGGSATYEVHVAKANATMSFTPNAVTIVEGQTFTAPTLTNAAGLAVSYESSNTAVATVDTNGNVTIVGIGSTVITATGAGNDNYNGTSATYTITVEPKPVVAAPTFTPAAGYYNSAQNVTIACETDGADIYYTTDGTDPTTESTKYTAAIPVDENMTIKAIAVKEGYTSSGIAVAEYVIDLPVQIAAPTFMPGSGHYTEAKEVAIACATPDASILYKIGDGEFQPYNKPFVVDQSCTVTAKVTMGGKTVWTDNEASATYTISTLDPVKITDGYYQIKNNGNGKYANVQGRKTMTFTNDIDQQAGTVIRVQSKDNGEVQVLRSQAADLQGYANRAMRYVPEIVQKVVDKLHAEGSGEILGEDGLDAIMQKFDECFDYHLYVEGDLDNCRIYGKTPSMQPVVDFYNENQAKVDAKLPMLVDFINDAIQKVLVKTEGHGASILVPFSLDTIWNRMGGMLIRPVDDESTMAFYHQVLTNKQYVWDFAYQAATFYLEKVQAHPRYEEMKEYLGEFGQYIDKLEQVRPDTKYFIVQNNGKVDYISEGNADIIRNEPWTFWSVEPRSEFKVNFPAENVYGGNYVTTLYTDFAYDLPKSISAYKLTDINEQGYAKMEVLDGTIPAQTPVMLVAEDAGVQTLTLNIAPNALADTTGNQLHGPDYLINKYEIKTPQVQALFNLAKRILGDNFYNNNVAQYEHLMLKTAGTVNNRYFWGITGADLDSCIYIDEEGTERLEVRSLDSGEQGLGFYNNWTVSANKAFLANAEFNPIKLSLRRDINRDGKINIADVTALINILLVLPDKPYLDVYDYEAADVNENGSLQIHDVSALINYLLRRANH